MQANTRAGTIRSRRRNRPSNPPGLPGVGRHGIVRLPWLLWLLLFNGLAFLDDFGGGVVRFLGCDNLFGDD